MRELPGESSLFFGQTVVHVAADGAPGQRQFALRTGTHSCEVTENSQQPFTVSGSPLFDGLFALALEEVRQNSVAAITAHAFDEGKPFTIDAFETGELWQYVWTRDLAYAVDLSLASLDVQRCMRSLMYKTSAPKPGMPGDPREQILQDTGSGGSYPVSTDRVVWALAAARVLSFLNEADQQEWVARTLPILEATIAQDRALVFDPATGLYCGEESFLDWREQTYPARTRHDVLAIAMSPSLSTNVTHFILLETAAAWASRSGQAAASKRYAGWADALKASINDRFFDPEAGLYSAFLLTELSSTIRVHRYDLLGNSLAILAGIAGPDRATQIIAAYPVGLAGPAVVWPQEPGVPIYHNHALWPFVTAYYAGAARIAGNESAVAAAVESLVRGAATCLSNMENLDFATGLPHATSNGITGPVINSRRQLWSVAGYVSMVQDTLAGMEVNDHAVCFRPCLPAAVRARYLSAGELSLQQLKLRGKQIDLTIRWPADAGDRPIAAAAVRVNGKPIGVDAWVTFDTLGERNDWQIDLQPGGARAANAIRTVDPYDFTAVFAPEEPRWLSEIELTDAGPRLRFAGNDWRAISFNIYRDGVLIAEHVRGDKWTDTASKPPHAGAYVIEIVDAATGNHSHPNEPRFCSTCHAAEQVMPQPIVCDREPVQFAVRIDHPGEVLLNLRYANGNGTINTGITCGVKRIEIRDVSGRTLASDYLILPQTGGWGTVLRSSPIPVRFDSPGTYTVHAFEDDVTRNMSYFDHNRRYTGHEGGGPTPCNAVRFEAVQMIRLGN